MAADTPPPQRWRATAARLAPAAIVAAVAIAAYANATGNGFVWDDHKIVVDNPDNADPSALGKVLTSPDVVVRSEPAPYYRPVSRALFVLDRQLFDLDPRPYHLENVLLHAAAAIALLALGLRLFGAVGPAAVAALLFAVHPVNTETVDFVTARNNLLVAVLVLASCEAYLRARTSRRTAPLLVAAVLFFLGTLCKETALMLLPFLAAQELLSRGALRRDALRERLVALAPLALAAALSLALRAAVLRGAGGALPGLADPASALVRALHVVPEYLGILLWPTNLTIHRLAPEAYLASPWALAAAWLAIVAALALLLRQGRPVTRFGLLWFAINLVPVSGLVPIPSAPLAERFLYVPSIGLWLVAADQLAALAGRTRHRRVLAGAVLVVIACLATVTLLRNRDWRDDVALYASAARAEPRSTDAHYNLGVALAERGDAEGARSAWERVLALDPAHTGALSQLGTALAERGDLEGAARCFARVLELRPRDIETRFNLALLFERLGRPRDALEQYRLFLALDPVDYPELVPRVRERIRTLMEASR
jgi:tetratricopeptide (TPR) repeat protein